MKLNSNFNKKTATASTKHMSGNLLLRSNAFLDSIATSINHNFSAISSARDSTSKLVVSAAGPTTDLQAAVSSIKNTTT